MNCILVVDADENLVELITRSLNVSGHQVIGAQTASEAIRSVQNVVIDLMILDVLTCVKEGPEACRALEAHAQLQDIHVLFLSYTGSLAEGRHTCAHANMFNIESADHLEKPFRMQELEHHVEVLLGGDMPGDPPATDDKLKIGGLSLDLRTRKVNAGGEAVLLTPREFELLRYLVENAGGVVSRDALLQYVWKGPAHAESPEVVRWHIRNLRAKINLSAGRPIQIIQTVPRHGYIIPK